MYLETVRINIVSVIAGIISSVSVCALYNRAEVTNIHEKITQKIQIKCKFAHKYT